MGREFLIAQRDDFVGLEASAIALDDVEGDDIALTQRLVTIAHDGAVMHEDIGAAVVAAKKAVAFGVIEPLYCACKSRHGFWPEWETS